MAHKGTRARPPCIDAVSKIACGSLSSTAAQARAEVLSGAPTIALVSDPARSSSQNTVEQILLAAPRGYCAGVDRAVQTVERALELHGAPVYVRKEIVHNKHVVEQLRERGAVFVASETEVPHGATVVFSAHGVAPTVHVNALERELRTIDA